MGSVPEGRTEILSPAAVKYCNTFDEQKGSYVSPDSLRFDFSHFQKVTDEELRQVERIANAKVRMAMPLDEHRNMPIAEARAMGAMALFGEKYGDEVRVVRFGSSVELCGGTHVANTGNIGMIRIVSESSIAAGIRRIEAITGAKVEDMVNDLEGMVKHIKMLFNNAANIIQTIEKSINENSDLRQQVDEFTKERTLAIKEMLIKNMVEENGVKLISYVGPMLPEVAKDLAFMLRGEISEHMAFIAATKKAGEEKPLLTVMLSDDLVAAGKNASQIVREAARLIQGGGGGQPHFAQAGGKDASKLKDALDKMRELVTA